MEGAERDMEIILMVFLKKKKKILSGQFGYFDSKMVRPRNVLSAPRFFFNFRH